MVSFTVETPDQEEESTEETIEESKPAPEPEPEESENDEPASLPDDAIPMLDENGNPNPELTNYDEDEEPETEEPTIPDGLGNLELNKAIKEYADWCIDHYDELEDVDLLDVPIGSSGNMKRTAGKVKHNRSTGKIEMRFSTNAYEEWDEEEFKSTIRHELIHVWQVQELGTGDHGASFKKKAEPLGCETTCNKFTDYKYELNCSNCDSLVGGRYQKSKIVKNPGDYNSKCCGADLKVEQVR